MENNARNTGRNLRERRNRRPAPNRNIAHTVKDVEIAAREGRSFQVCRSLKIKSPRSFKRQPETFIGKLSLSNSFVDYAAVRGIIEIDKSDMGDRTEKPLMYIYEIIENTDNKLIVDAEIILCETHSEGVCLWPFYLRN